MNNIESYDEKLYSCVETLKEAMEDYKRCIEKEHELEATGYYSRIDPDDFNETDYELQIEKREIEDVIRTELEEKEDIIQTALKRDDIPDDYKKVLEKAVSFFDE
jgi:protein-tyrosine-phosphatase